MIKVTKIRVHEFRGIRDLALNLKGANFAVCGPNGTGKSGIVDAIEFALTGSISRLSGTGTGGLSVKEHGPHVDSRNKPEEAYVVLTLQLPSGEEVEVHRSVKEAKAPAIKPDTAEIRQILGDVALHPEFVLSRRELIRYVLAEPGKRSEEVQELLRLDEIETLRTLFQRISNAEARAVEQLKRAEKAAIDAMLSSLQIAELTKPAVLVAVNSRRAILSLPPFGTLESTTSLKDGLATVAGATPVARVSKVQVTTDVKVLREKLAHLESEGFVAAQKEVLEACVLLTADADLLQHLSRADLLKSALAEFDGERCPVCDTPWTHDAFQKHVNAKLAAFSAASAKRKEVEDQCTPIIDGLSALQIALASVRAYGPLLPSPMEVQALKEFDATLSDAVGQIEKLLPIDTTIEAVKACSKVPDDVSALVDEIESAVAALPEPSAQDAAREYLVIAQDKYENVRFHSRNRKAGEARAAKASKIFELYGTTTTAALDAIYKDVETVFGDLYREINKEDESSFTAQLTPSLGKLGFDVDFYGRGHFPPGAYHSEGHQDGMGLCLYLALMSHLLGKGFTFAVLDDVLMSVDSGHRREVCALLKATFPNTQFILTTHDEIWLRHMKTAGLIQGGAAAHFRKWTVDQGPTEWDDRDIWQELDEALEKNDVPKAAAALRHYLEYFSREACHRLRAQVEFRGDHLFTLGDLMPNAVAALGKALKKGKEAAQSWGHKEAFTRIEELEKAFDEAKKETSVENWQVNSAVHYNEWANLQRKDFIPVVGAFKKLVTAMRCEKCEEVLYVSPSQGNKEAVRCLCGAINISLIPK